MVIIVVMVIKHSTIIVSYNTGIILPVPKTDIFKWNKTENILIVLYG
jgi:hypothetical protein